MRVAPRAHRRPRDHCLPTPPLSLRNPPHSVRPPCPLRNAANAAVSGLDAVDTEAQAQAQAFMRRLVDPTVGATTPEAISAVATRAKTLSMAARKIVASVVGLPSADALLEAVCSLTPHTLADLRRQFSAMGFADCEDDGTAATT